MFEYIHRIILEFDGASRNNPYGPAGCGFVVYEMDWDGSKGNLIHEENEYLGYNVSNNQAEYKGLINGLVLIYNYYNFRGLYIRGDSEIVIHQLNGNYAVGSPNISHLYEVAKQSIQNVDCMFVKIQHISRSLNYEADELANQAIYDNEY